MPRVGQKGGGGFQPYAAGQPRPQTSALAAMLAGGPGGGLPAPMDSRGPIQSQGTEQALAPIRSRVLDEFAQLHRRG